MKQLILLLLAGSAFLQATAAAAPLDGLYFGLDNMRGFAEVYWWFRADGRLLRNVLPSGLTAEKFDAACQENSGSCAHYTFSGDKLTIQPKSGNPETWTYKPLNGGIQLNYLILTPVGKYPAGARLAGTWDRPFSAQIHSGPGSNTTITSPTFYTFRPDGTFSIQNITGVDHQSPVRGANTGGSRQTQSGGTYTISGNVLALNRNGANEQHMIFPVAGGNLNIDGMVYKKR